MKYQNEKGVDFDIGPGTAGVAQRIPSEYKISEEREGEKSSGLFALMYNDVMSCSHNQY